MKATLPWYSSLQLLPSYIDDSCFAETVIVSGTKKLETLLSSDMCCAVRN